MTQFLTILAFVAGNVGAIFAALSGRAWFAASKLPVPIVSKDVLSATTAIGVRLPLSFNEEADRRKALGVAMVTFLKAANARAELNQQAAKLSMLAAFAGSIALFSPQLDRFGIWMDWWRALA